MATRGRLEAQITVPSGGWDVDLDDGSSATATIPAGDYYLVDFCDELETQLDSASSASETYSVTVSDGESGTGKCTISNGGTNFTIGSWSEIRDILGFQAGVSHNGQSSYTSEYHCRMMWLPDVAKYSRYGDGDPGTEKTNARASQNGSTVKIIYGKRWTELEPGDLRWTGISHARTRIGAESLTNESLEKFWRDGILGEGPGGSPGGPVRLYWDADNDSDYTDYVPIDLIQTFRPGQMKEAWTGAWVFEFGRAVMQSDS